MFTIIYEKTTGIVKSITSETNADNLSKAINDDLSFIRVDDLPKYNMLRQRLVVKNNILIVEDLQLTSDQLKMVEWQEYSSEKTQLIEWFNTEYTYKEQKYRRLIVLNKADDDGVDGNTKLLALYNEAEEKRARIQELEQCINNINIV